MPLLIALLFFLPVDTIPVSPDGAYYAGQAMNLLNGKGLTYMDGRTVLHRPLFPIILSIAYALFTTSPIVGYFVVKGFAIANLILVTLLTKKLYGSAAALAAGLLIATSYRFNEWSGWLNLDFVMPSFLLLYFWALYQGMVAATSNSMHRFWLIVAGICLGAACLVKELALLFLPLPFVFGLLQKELKWRTVAVHAAYVYIGLILALAPGLIYVTARIGNPIELFGSTFGWGGGLLLSPFKTMLEGEFTMAASSDAALRFLMAPAYYFGWQLLAHFIVAPLFIPASILILGKWWRGSKPDGFLLSAMLLFLPMVFLQGLAGFRERQSLILMYLLMIGLAGLLLTLSRWVLDRIPNSRGRFLIASVPIVMVIGLQGSWDMAGNMRLLLLRSNSFAADARDLMRLPIRAPQPWWPTETTIAAAQQLAHWIEEEEQPPGKKFYTFDVGARYTNFLTNGKHKFYTIRSSSPNESIRIGNDRIDPSGDEHKTNDILMVALQPPNALLSWRVERRDALPFYQVRLYRQSVLLQAIQERGIDYVVVGNQERWLMAYFLLHPDFRKLSEFEYGEMHLFAVLTQNPQPIDLPPLVESDVIDFLTELEEIDGTRYEEIIDKVFIQGLGWNRTELSADSDKLEAHRVSDKDFGYEMLARWIVRTQEWSHEDLKAMNKTQATADAWALQGAIQFSDSQLEPEDRYQSAVGHYERAFEIDEHHWSTAELTVQLCSTIKEDQELYVASEDLKAACSYDAHAVDATGKESNHKDSDEHRTLLARALSIYQETASGHSPRNPNAYMQLASAYEKLGDFAMVLQTYDQAVENRAATAGLYLAYYEVAEPLLTDDAITKILQDGIGISSWDDPAYAALQEGLIKYQ